jgi:predicted component of type VI protein secretion system
MQQKRNLQRIVNSAADANVMLKQFTDHPAETYQLLLKLAGQIAFETALASRRKNTKLQHRTIIEFTNLLLAALKADRDTRKS